MPLPGQLSATINSDVMERDFEELLASLRPSHDMYRLAVALFRELWDARVAASHGNRAQLQAEVKLLEQQIEQLVDRIVNTESPAVLNAYETRLASLETQKAKAAEMVANCGRPITDFDSAHRTALEFLENPIKTWTCGTLEAKRGVIRMAFASRLSYQRGHGFRTAETAIPFRIFNDLEGLESEDSEMVPRRGVELSSQAMPGRLYLPCKISDLSCKVFAVGRSHLPEIPPKCGNECGTVSGVSIWEQTPEIP